MDLSLKTSSELNFPDSFSVLCLALMGPFELNVNIVPMFPLTLFHLHPPPQSSMNRMAIQALEKMETRKFKAKGKGQRESSCGASDSLSSSSTSDCAICLEKYIDGEVRQLRGERISCFAFGWVWSQFVK